jgi:hypothetical protein
LDWLVKRPDAEDCAPLYWHEGRAASPKQQPTQLYVEPCVLKGDFAGDINPAPAGVEGRQTQGQQDLQIETGIPWNLVWQAAGSHTDPWKAVLLGSGGQGKSLLLQMALCQNNLTIL